MSLIRCLINSAEIFNRLCSIHEELPEIIEKQVSSFKNHLQTIAAPKFKRERQYLCALFLLSKENVGPEKEKEILDIVKGDKKPSISFWKTIVNKFSPFSAHSMEDQKRLLLSSVSDPELHSKLDALKDRFPADRKLVSSAIASAYDWFLAKVEKTVEAICSDVTQKLIRDSKDQLDRELRNTEKKEYQSILQVLIRNMDNEHVRDPR